MGKNISKNLNSKYSQKALHHTKKSGIDALKISSKKVIQETAGSTGDLIGNKIANKSFKKFTTETVTNEHDEEIPKERYISLEE